MAGKIDYGKQTKAKRQEAHRKATLYQKFAPPKSAKGQKGELSPQQIASFYNR